jgi:hypothetical protein
MEDEIGEIYRTGLESPEETALQSIAVSLKRIADALTGSETCASPLGHDIWRALQDHATSRSGR